MFVLYLYILCIVHDCNHYFHIIVMSFKRGNLFSFGLDENDVMPKIFDFCSTYGLINEYENKRDCVSERELKRDRYIERGIERDSERGEGTYTWLRAKLQLAERRVEAKISLPCHTDINTSSK